MLPNCLIIGPAKCATSSLHYYLKQHPEIMMSAKKECHFFCHQDIDLSLYEEKYWPIRSREDYEAFFPKEDGVRVWGESSPMYLYYTNAAQRIRETIPDCKLIAVLRNPVDRAFSAYTHAVRDELEPLSFLDAIAAEDERTASGKITPLQAYVECGRYAEKLRPYVEQFDRGQIKVIPYERLKEDLQGVLREICEFLEVKSSFAFEIKPRLNRSGVPKRRWVQKMVQAACDDRFPYSWIKRPFTNHGWIRTVKGIEFWNYRLLKITAEEREAVKPMFRDDVAKLDSMLGADFGKRWGISELDSSAVEAS